MTEFVEYPNLPEKECGVVISGGLYEKAKSELALLGVTVITPSQEPNLNDSLNLHADLSFSYLGRGEAIVSRAQERLKNSFLSIGGKILGEEDIGAVYPLDVPLNALFAGNRLFCNKKHISHHILKYCVDRNIKIYHINQGYSKCSVCIVSRDSVITEDRGVYEAFRAAGECDVLLISPGFVDLPSYDRGFIGGCCGKISKDVLVFNGKIEDHPDYTNIKAFCRNQNVEPYSLTDDRLFDNGGIIPLVYQ